MCRVGRSLSARVDENRDAVADDLRVDEFELNQCLHELGAAMHDEVTFVPVPQLRDLVADVAPYDRRVLPFGCFEGRRHDVLRHGVELLGEGTFPRWPGSGKALVRPTPEQECLGCERLVQLELVALVAAANRERPPTVPKVFAPAWV